MNPILAAKIAVLVLVIASFAGLSFATHHYYKAYLGELQNEEILKSNQAQLETSLKACSDASAELKKQSDAKDEQIKADLEAAEVVAKKQYAKGQTYLLAKPSTPGNICKSADDLFNKYLDDQKGAAK